MIHTDKSLTILVQYYMPYRSMSRFEFEQIDLAITSLLANQLRSHRCRNAHVISVSIVVTAVAIFRLVDNLMPSLIQIVH